MKGDIVILKLHHTLAAQITAEIEAVAPLQVTEVVVTHYTPLVDAKGFRYGVEYTPHTYHEIALTEAAHDQQE
jgi:hypothetical protein